MEQFSNQFFLYGQNGTWFDIDPNFLVWSEIQTKIRHMSELNFRPIHMSIGNQNFELYLSHCRKLCLFIEISFIPLVSDVQNEFNWGSHFSRSPPVAHHCSGILAVVFSSDHLM